LSCGLGSPLAHPSGGRASFHYALLTHKAHDACTLRETPLDPGTSKKVVERPSEKYKYCLSIVLVGLGLVDTPGAHLLEPDHIGEEPRLLATPHARTVDQKLGSQIIRPQNLRSVKG
jgi:hypothetical protein